MTEPSINEVYSSDYGSKDLIINGEITDICAKQCIRSLFNILSSHESRNKQDPTKPCRTDTRLTLDIIINNSSSGNPEAALSIYDTIMLLKKANIRVRTTALNRCDAIAPIIFMAGDIRRAGTHTKFTIQNMPMSIKCKTADDISKHADRLRKFNADIAAVYERGGFELEKIVKIMEEGEEFDAHEAREIGIATHIF